MLIVFLYLRLHILCMFHSRIALMFTLFLSIFHLISANVSVNNILSECMENY